MRGVCIEPPSVEDEKEPLTINDKPTITVATQQTLNIANHEPAAYSQSYTLHNMQEQQSNSENTDGNATISLRRSKRNRKQKQITILTYNKRGRINNISNNNMI